MLIIDAQVHVWPAETADHPWLPGPAADDHRGRQFTGEMLIAEMDRAGVHAAVIIPPAFTGARNDVALQAATDHPGRIGVMGRVDLDDPIRGTASVRSWRSHPGALGFRLTFAPRGQNGTRSQLTDGSADWFWPVADQASLPVMIHCPGLLDELGVIAGEFPSIAFVVDHLGLPPAQLLDEGALHARLGGLEPLARLDNVAVKIGPIPCYTAEPYPYPAFQRHLQRIIDWFGAARVFWASDLTRLPCPYADLVRFYLDELDFLDDDARELILGRGVLQWLRWTDAER